MSVDLLEGDGPLIEDVLRNLNAAESDGAGSSTTGTSTHFFPSSSGVNLEESEADNQNEVMIPASWHEAMKDFNRQTPSAPYLYNFSSPKEFVEPGHETWAANDAMTSKSAAPATQRTQRTAKSGGGTFTKTDIRTLQREGWDMGKGWFSRPKSVNTSPEHLDSEIDKWKDRLKEANETRHINYATAPRMRLKQSELGGTKMKAYRSPTPGPRYRIASPGTDTLVASTRFAGECFEYAEKKNRFPPLNNLGPGPAYNPKWGTVESGRPCTRFSTSHRNDKGGFIYPIEHSVPPGPVYNDDTSVKSRSQAKPCNGTVFEKAGYKAPKTLRAMRRESPLTSDMSINAFSSSKSTSRMLTASDESTYRGWNKHFARPTMLDIVNAGWDLSQGVRNAVTAQVDKDDVGNNIKKWKQRMQGTYTNKEKLRRGERVQPVDLPIDEKRFSPEFHKQIYSRCRTTDAIRSTKIEDAYTMAYRGKVV